MIFDISFISETGLMVIYNGCCSKKLCVQSILFEYDATSFALLDLTFFSVSSQDLSKLDGDFRWTDIFVYVYINPDTFENSVLV